MNRNDEDYDDTAIEDIYEWEISKPQYIFAATSATTTTTTSPSSSTSFLVVPPPPLTSNPIGGTSTTNPTNAVSQNYKAQFLVELVMRFSALKSLKDLDHGIAASNLVFGEKLGGGSFGTVFRAKLRGLDVAVKQLKGILTNEAILNLKIEVEILSRLRHPHILLYIGISQTPGFSAMVTEWCSLGSLQDLLRNYRNVFTAKQLLKFALEISEGMWYMHSMEKLWILHRDLKAANILVHSNWTTKIADFGLAVMTKREEDAGEQEDYHGYCGTPQWMAPEVLRRNEKYGQKADVYSFGILLTELFTRKVPYLDHFKHLDFIPAVISSQGKLRPSLPRYFFQEDDAPRARELGEVIMSCIHEDAKQRPDFSQIIAKLEALYQLVADDDLYLFTQFELPRYRDTLQFGVWEDVALVGRELFHLLSMVKTEEQRQVLQIVSEQFMQLLLQRISKGTALQCVENEDVEQSGGAFRLKVLGWDVLEDLVCCVRLLSENMNRRLPQVITVDQIETLMRLFFEWEDRDERGIRACGELLQQLNHVSKEVQTMFDLHLESKSEEERVLAVKRCCKYKVLMPQNQVDLEIDLLQHEVEELEQHLFERKKRLMELRFNSKVVLLRRRKSSMGVF